MIPSLAIGKGITPALITPRVTKEPAPKLTEFDRYLIRAESIVREIDDAYDRTKLEEKIKSLAAIPPNNTRYKEAQVALARYQDNLLTLRLGQSLGDMVDYLRKAHEFIDELTAANVDLHDRLGVMEGMVRLVAKFPDTKAAVPLSTTPAHAPADSRSATPEQ